MKRIFNKQFLTAIAAYLFIIGLATFFLFGYLQKIKLANEKNRQEMGAYQNLKVQDNRFTGNYQKLECSGNLFFQAGAPVSAVHVYKDHLYLSQIDNKLKIVDLSVPQVATFSASAITDFYTDANGIYGTDFLNDQVVRFILEDGNLVTEKVYTKIGHVSALTRVGPKGYFYAAGYASGNITKIVGRDGFLFLPDLDKITDLEASGSDHLLAARYDAKPTLVSISVDQKKQTVIEQNKSVSSLTFDGDSFWVVYDFAGKSQIGNIINDRLVDNQVLNCSFPVKLAVSSDKLFYTSLADSEGKVYWINKNLQKNGK